MQVPKVHVDEILSIADKYTNIHINGGSPGGSVAKESACSAGDLGSTLGQEDPLEKGMETHSVFLPGEFHRQRILVGYCPWDLRVRHN